MDSTRNFSPSMKNREELERYLCAIVERQPDGADSPAFGEALARLDALAKGPKADLPPHFRHFLERRSYGKALAWLRESAD